MAHILTRGLNRFFVTLILVALSLAEVYAQEERRDSLQASTVYADKERQMAGVRIVKPVDFLHMPCAVGSADAVKFIQTLPGVSTGAEGSSAIYVRGGNLGNNLITLDGIPIYGGSHLLGFSSAYSPDIVSNVLFQSGGFTSEESNLTSSHISVSSLDGSMSGFRAGVSVSNFLFGAKVSTPIIRDRLSLIASVRVSPIGAELGAVKGLTNAMDSISGIKAAVYDVFGKLKWRIDRRHDVYLSVFSSLDSYGYRYGVTSDDRMRWDNLIVNCSHDFAVSPRGRLHSSVSYNQFSNFQGMRKLLGDGTNNLAMQNALREWTLQSAYSFGIGNGLDLRGGLKARRGEFAPGTSTAYTGNLSAPLPFHDLKDVTGTWLVTAHAQAEFVRPQMCQFRVAGRLNRYSSRREENGRDDRSYLTPEASLLARVNILGPFGLEATADWTAQYYHTLEGIPLGWSLDMIVPSDALCGPERAVQYYVGSYLSSRKHKFNVGAYYKEMSGLTYFAEATQIFNSAVASWRHNIKTGSGRSYGLEALYEISGDRLRGRVAYTLSKTDRLFKEINNGERFPAKFDRRHILNVNAEYTLLQRGRKEAGLVTLFTYQSGHHDNLPIWEYVGELLPNGEEKVPVEYYAGENAARLPAYIRWDMGFYLKSGMGTSHPWVLNIGVFNVLNRHNVYSITFDTAERKWKQISLFPIMPSLSWTMEF